MFNLVILNLAPSGPLFGSDADDPAFMSDAWWDLLDGVCEDAAELGVSPLVLRPVGLLRRRPAGTTGRRQPRYAGSAGAAAVVDGDGELSCPADGRPVGAHAEPLDEAGRVAGPAVPLTVEGRSVRPPGPGRWRLDTAPPGFTRLRLPVRRGVRGAARPGARRVRAASGPPARQRGRRLVPGRAAVAAHLVGPTSPRSSSRLRGYDLVPFLDALCEDDVPEAARVRHDYQLTRAELAEEAFFRPLAELARAARAARRLRPAGPGPRRTPGRGRRAVRRLRAHPPLVQRAGLRPPRRRPDPLLPGAPVRPAAHLDRGVPLHRLGRHAGGDVRLAAALAAGRGANLYNPHAVYSTTKGRLVGVGAAVAPTGASRTGATTASSPTRSPGSARCCPSAATSATSRCCCPRRPPRPVPRWTGSRPPRRARRRPTSNSSAT